MDQSTLRIMDANFNRAREALRVMEEYARFVLNDTMLSATIKRARHDLLECLKSASRKSGGEFGVRADMADPADLTAHRDIVHDVGRDITTPEEGVRHDVHDVVTAACKRLSESLRALEEYGKTLSATLGGDMEKLRYEGYEIERRLLLIARARDRLVGARLYVILTASLCRNEWFETALATLKGGADVLQLREKTLDDADLLARATRLSSLCHEHGALCIVNDRPDIAVLAGADGVHVGRGDLAITDVRRVLPSSSIIGTSTHTVEQVKAACEQTPDYIAVGPMYPTETKPQDHIAGPVTLRAARELTALPLVAIGGISAGTVRDVVTSGADCLCVCSQIIAQADVAAATNQLRTAIDTMFDTTAGNQS